MSLKSSDNPQDKVVALLKKLDEDAAHLRQEAETLQESRQQWSLTQTPDGKQLPSRCLNKLEQAVAYDEQTQCSRRRESTGKREAKRATEERQAVESAAAARVQDADQRRLSAEQRLVELRRIRREAEAEHSYSNAAEDLSNDAELAVIQRQIEEIRKAVAIETKQARRDTAAQRSRGEREVQEVNADFERRAEAYERALQEYDDACDKAVAEAQAQAKEAEEVGEKAWEQWEAQVHSSPPEVSQQLELEDQSPPQEGIEDETDKRLAEDEAKFSRELAEIYARERAIDEDCVMEERARALRVEVAEFIRSRRAERDARVHECLNTIARLTKEATEAAAGASRRAEAMQTKTDREVQAVVDDMEKFGCNDLKGSISEAHARLEAAVGAAKDEFAKRMQAFHEQVDLQTREANRSLANADKKVEELRVNSVALKEESSLAMTSTIKDIRAERDRVVADSSVKVIQTQEQLVRFVGSQYEDMMCTLSKTEPEEVPLQLDLSAAILG